jgi:sec-independent protein translocase protein TatA
MLAFFSISGGEIIVVFLFVLLFFGAKAIPSFARNMGKGMRQMKDAMGEIQKEINSSAQEIKNQVEAKSNEVKSPDNTSGNTEDKA